MMKKLYDLDISKGTPDEKLRRMEDEYGILVTTGDSISVAIKGKKLSNLMLTAIPLMTLIDNEYLIIKDKTEFRNIHAFDLEGRWLWDIEGCNDQYGNPVNYFFDIGDSTVDENGEKLLRISSYPEVYATNLKTGKGTKIVKIYDDTNDR